MRKVSIVIELEDDKQANELEVELREVFAKVIYTYLPDTKELEARDPVFKKMLKASYKSKDLIKAYINENN